MKDGKERLRERIEGIDCRGQIAESRFRIICKGRLNVNELQKKMDVLQKITAEFNKDNLLWAIGASLLLYFKGVAEVFHDIDIMVDEKDVERCKNILLNMGTMGAASPDPQYKTRTFIEFTVDEVEIDVIAGFVIVDNGMEHDCSLKPDQITEFITIGKERVPLQGLALWRQYYEWMGRTSKVELIDKFAEHKTGTGKGER